VQPQISAQQGETLSKSEKAWRARLWATWDAMMELKRVDGKVE